MENNNLVIDVKNLKKSFGHLRAVDGISLRVKKGEIFGFLGPNGSGKTTTIRMLCGLLVPDEVQGTCLGYNVLTQSYEIKKHVGYMTQSFTLYNELTVFENLDFVSRLYSIKNRLEKIQETLEEFNFQERKNQLAATLSGGLKQRLSLAAALIHDPQLLLLDEPTAGVDPKSRREFWTVIHRLSSKGITTLVSTHYMDEADRCTRLAFISKGKILTQGSFAEISKKMNLVTFQILTQHLFETQNELQKNPGISAVIFGNQLHVTALDKELIEKSIQSLKTPIESYSEITPGIEDIFITLVSDKEEQKT